MDDTGYTFVGQEALAASTGLSRPTVRAAVKDAWAAGWIAVKENGLGQQWRGFAYWACIPDALEINNSSYAKAVAKMGLIDASTFPNFASKVGKPTTHLDSPKVGNFSPEGGKESTERWERIHEKVGKSTTTNSYQRTLKENSLRELLRGGDDINIVSAEKPKAPEPEASEMIKPKPAPKPTEAELRAAKVELAAKGIDGGLDEAFIRRQFGLTLEEVQRERKPPEKSNGADAGAAITITGCVVSAQAQTTAPAAITGVCASCQSQGTAGVGTVGIVRALARGRRRRPDGKNKSRAESRAP